ncbi:hypothetical protein V5O48_018969 [Marasmius crinis-equi]|uniref:Uncharacterized protein n=1 Tax=Marasmius crinis-equi TaxID=585013 RepID=A0ABR3EJP4_9AGAR
MPKSPLLTFAQPRSAPPPKVIPLFATPILVSAKRALLVHETAPKNVRFWPYPATPTVAQLLPARFVKTAKPNATVQADTDPVPCPQVGQSGPTAQPEVVVVPRPPNFQLSHWPAHYVTAVRSAARDAILKHLDAAKCLDKQDATALHCAREMVFQDARQSHDFSNLRTHEDFWGVNAVLRDQLRSMRDTGAARVRRNTRNEPFGSSTTSQ